MKHINKIFSLLLALVMVLSLTTTAFAADDNKITIEITNPDANTSVAGHTYNVYQIFTGVVAKDGKTLSDVAFGQNYAPADTTVEDAMATLSAMKGAEAAAYLETKIVGEPIAVLKDSNNHKAENLDAGYYLIIDVSTSLPQGEISSAYILQALEDVAIKSKHSAGPKVEKKIDDANDSVDLNNPDDDVPEIVWADSADHDIGDMIPFKLEMIVPSSFAQFKEYEEAYRFVFHDTEERGLTFQPDTVVVKIDGTVITSGYEVDTAPEDKHTFDVIFADLTAIESVKVGSKVTVEYKSRLNESAVLGQQGNVNTVYGEYSNLHRPEYPGRTPDDTVIAFTYKVVVNKVHQTGVDEEGKPVYEELEGAAFTLEKYIAQTGKWIAIQQVETEPGTTFTFTGLDDGDYRLTETATPDGYNSIDPITFTVTAAHEVEWTTDLERDDILTSLSGNVTTGEIKFTASNDLGTLSTDVVNESGLVLPETGGIGTTIFYIVGGLLTVGAVVLLVTKKRMGADA